MKLKNIVVGLQIGTVIFSKLRITRLKIAYPTRLAIMPRHH